MKPAQSSILDPRSSPVPQELARKGITGARHDLPAGMEVNCARDIALIFGEEIKAKLAAVSRQQLQTASSAEAKA